MKKQLLYSFLVAVCATLVSCGSKQSVVTAPQQTNPSNPYGEKLQLTECESYALAAPGKRAVGKGTSFNESTARQLAELDARAAFSNAIDVAVKAGAEAANFDITKYMGTDNAGATNTDGGGRNNTDNTAFSANIIKNTNIVKLDKYFGKNRQYTVFVCLEYNGSIADMVKSATQNVRQLVSDEDRNKIDENLNAFQKKMEDELQNRSNSNFQ